MRRSQPGEEVGMRHSKKKEQDMQMPWGRKGLELKALQKSSQVAPEQ